MRLHFVDTDGDLVEELRRAFASVADVTCTPGDILAVARHTLVSPANSYGFMDGGIDAAYSAFFGSQNCYRAMRAVRRLVEAESELALDVFCPGLATGTGRVPPADAAREMFKAYEDWRSRLYR